MKFLIKYIYTINRGGGKPKSKSANITVELDAEPRHLYQSPKLHQYLGGEAQKKTRFPVQSIEIKSITETKNGAKLLQKTKL